MNRRSLLGSLLGGVAAPFIPGGNDGVALTVMRHPIGYEITYQTLSEPCIFCGEVAGGSWLKNTGFIPWHDSTLAGDNIVHNHCLDEAIASQPYDTEIFPNP
jgi:hypothetical protein